MRKKIGIACVVLGVACLLGALGFVLYNRWEANNAAKSAKSLLADVQTAISDKKITYPSQNTDTLQQEEPLVDVIQIPEMPTVQVDGYDCIGILSVPALELELPVLTEWSYAKLKKAPCHYYGSYYESDFVIAAHNYQSHFGRLSQLQAGDVVTFTAVDGTVYVYEVVLLETLPKEATQEMIVSTFDLSLYTCTPGGANRVTVRCIKK